MKADDNDKQLDDLIHAAVGRDGPAFDFETWKQEHQTEVNQFQAESAHGIDQRRRRTHFLDLIRRRSVARLAVAVGLIIVLWLGTPRWGNSHGGLAFGEALRQTVKIQTFHARLYQNGKESEIWGKRPNMLRWVYDEDIIEISNGPTLWVVNIPFNKATQKPSYYFQGAQRRGLDVIDDFLQVRFTEGLSGFFSEEPVGRVQREDKVFDVYRMEFNVQEGLMSFEALVDAETHLLHSLSLQVGQGDDISTDLRFTVTDYDVPLSDDLFAFKPGPKMKVIVEEPEPSEPQTMTAEEGSTLSGRIVWAHNGKPLSAARLSLGGGGLERTPKGLSKWKFFVRAETDRDGYWHITGAPKGPVKLSVRSWELDWPAMPTFTTNVGTSKDPRIIVDGQSEYTGLDFQVYRPNDFYAHLTAKVVNEDGKPVRDVSAYLEYTEASDIHQHVYATKRRHQYTRRDGKFDDSEIWATYRPVRMHVGHKDPNGPYPLRGVHSEPFVIEPKQECHLDIVLPYEREMTVQVLDIQGHPLEGICVNLIESEWGGSVSPASYQLEDQVFSDSDGLVHGSGLLPGESILVALKRLDANEPDLWSPLVANITPATVPTDRSVPLVQVTFDDRPIVIEGTLDPGFPIDWARVAAYVTGEPGDLRHMPFARVKTDEEGRFSLRGIPAGAIRLLYSATGPDRGSQRAEGSMTVERGNAYQVEFTNQQFHVLEQHPIAPSEYQR